jgi:hypothetical protein
VGKSAVPVALAIVALLSAAVSQAAAPNPRAVTFSDPQDVPTPLSGPADPDVKSLTVAYDTSGTITVTTTFYAPFLGGDLEYGIDFNLGNQMLAGRCSAIDAEPGGAVYIDKGGVGSGIFTIQNVSGSLSPTVTHSPDATTYTAVFSSGAIANKDWTCAGTYALSVFFWEFSWCQDPGCPISSSVVDSIQQSAWYPGYSPADLARPYWRLSAKRDGLGGFDLYVRNSKASATLGAELDYKACVGVKGGKRHCQSSTLSSNAPDDLSFVLTKNVLRPLRVSIWIGGVLQTTARVSLR